MPLYFCSVYFVRPLSLINSGKPIFLAHIVHRGTTGMFLLLFGHSAETGTSPAAPRSSIGYSRAGELLDYRRDGTNSHDDLTQPPG